MQVRRRGLTVCRAILDPSLAGKERVDHRQQHTRDDVPSVHHVQQRRINLESEACNVVESLADLEGVGDGPSSSSRLDLIRELGPHRVQRVRLKFPPLHQPLSDGIQQVSVRRVESYEDREREINQLGSGQNDGRDRVLLTSDEIFGDVGSDKLLKGGRGRCLVLDELRPGLVELSSIVLELSLMLLELSLMLLELSLMLLELSPLLLELNPLLLHLTVMVDLLGCQPGVHLGEDVGDRGRVDLIRRLRLRRRARARARESERGHRARAELQSLVERETGVGRVLRPRMRRKRDRVSSSSSHYLRLLLFPGRSELTLFGLDVALCPTLTFALPSASPARSKPTACQPHPSMLTCSPLVRPSLGANAPWWRAGVTTVEPDCEVPPLGSLPRPGSDD